MKQMPIAAQDAHIDRANQEWDRLSPEARESLTAVIEKLQDPDHDLKVERLAKTWFVLSHDSAPYKVQLIADNHGSNLDLSIHRPDSDNYFISPLTSVKLLSLNVGFAVQRVMAAFGLHDTSTSGEHSQTSALINDTVYRDFRAAHNYLSR